MTPVSLILALDVCGSGCRPELHREDDKQNNAQFPFAGPLLELATKLEPLIELADTAKPKLYAAAASAVRRAGWPRWSIGDYAAAEVAMRSRWNFQTLSWDPIGMSKTVVAAWRLTHTDGADHYTSDGLVTKTSLPATARMCPVIMLQYEGP